jgi:hypothetical protein
MKKLFIRITMISLLCLTVILYFTWQFNLPVKQNSKDDYIEIYKSFLKGDKTANIGDEAWTINTLAHKYGSTLDEIKYAFFDMNGDGNPELHIRTPRFYIILTYRDNNLILWREESVYSQPLNNKAMLYERPGGAPIHINYKYSVFDFYGEVSEEINFEKYDNNNNGIYDDSDLYLFLGVKIPKKDWDKLTSKYLSIDSDQIKWLTYS